jgi:hypothetical protein
MEFLCQVLDYVSMTGFVYAAKIKEIGLYLHNDGRMLGLLLGLPRGPALGGEWPT